MKEAEGSPYTHLLYTCTHTWVRMHAYMHAHEHVLPKLGQKGASSIIKELIPERKGLNE